MAKDAAEAYLTPGVDDVGAPDPVTIVVTGSPSDGFTHHGPFEAGGAACIWAEKNCDGSWWLVDLYGPEED